VTRYRVYGLELDSSIDVDGLQPVDSSSEPDLTLRAGSVSLLRDAIELEAAETRVQRSGGTYLFEFADGTRFLIDERTITVSWSPPATVEDVATYLLGPILAFVVRLGGTLAIHASAFVIDDRALLVSGVAGAGKSTIAAAFLSRGMPMLTDDVAAIQWRGDVPWVLPGYARLRLWDDSAEALYGSSDVLALLTPTWTKRYVDARDRFVLESKAICAIVALAPRHDEPTRVRRLSGHEAAMALLVRTAMTSLLDPALRERELDEVTRLAARVPVIEVTPHRDLRATDELIDVIAAAVQ
jgi:hypothetical protein